jgi:peptidyl-prolyl cis-trans isomerase-like 4
MASGGENLNASQFYITLRDELDYLDEKHTVSLLFLPACCIWV